jgi:hypothetical protein
LEASFPIPIHISQSDLDLAATGHLVTRVVYLEDPQTALPVAEKPGVQRAFDVTGVDDPLHVADELGKPMAILRIGSRVAPDRPEQMNEFLLGCPPWIPIYPHPTPEQVPTQSLPISTAGIPRPADSTILRR